MIMASLLLPDRLFVNTHAADEVANIFTLRVSARKAGFCEYGSKKCHREKKQEEGMPLLMTQ